jgi:hypothetical protein
MRLFRRREREEKREVEEVPAGQAEPSPVPPPERSLEPSPPPRSHDPSVTISLSLEEAKAALRAAGADTIQVGFLARACARSEEGPEREAAHALLLATLEGRLRSRGLVEEGQRFELLEERAPAYQEDPPGQTTSQFG